MNFAQRAIASVTRKWGKTALLLILIILLGNVIAGSVAVTQAVDNTELRLRMLSKPVATIELDYEKVYGAHGTEANYEPDYISAATIEQIGALPYVKHFDYSVQATLESSLLKRYHKDAENVYGDAYFSITGVNDPDILDIKEGKARLVSGRVFTKQEIENISYVAVVSQNFADTNDIVVGSFITLNNHVYDPSKIRMNEKLEPMASQKYDFEIIGIFEPSNQEIRESNGNPHMDNQRQFMEDEAENRIYAPNRVLNGMYLSFGTNILWDSFEAQNNIDGKIKGNRWKGSQTNYVVSLFDFVLVIYLVETNRFRRFSNLC